MSVFQVLSRQNLISRTFEDTPVNSSTFQACVCEKDVCQSEIQPKNPSIIHILPTCKLITGQNLEMSVLHRRSYMSAHVYRIY